MKCNSCSAISKVICSCGYTLCEAHGLNHSKYLMHLQQIINDKIDAEQNYSNELQKKVSNIYQIQKEVCAGAADLIKLIRMLSKSYNERLENIKLSYLRKIGESIQNQVEDLKAPYLKGATELLKKAYEIKAETSDKKNVEYQIAKKISENKAEENKNKKETLETKPETKQVESEFKTQSIESNKKSSDSIIESKNLSENRNETNEIIELGFERIENEKQLLADINLSLDEHLATVKIFVGTSDNNFIITGGNDTIIRIWNLNTRRLEASLVGHTKSVEAIVVTNDNDFFVSASFDSTIRIWNLKKRCKEAVLTGHSSFVSDVALTSDNNLIVSGSFDKSVRIWNFKNRLQEAVLEKHSRAVIAVVVTKDNKYIVSGSEDRTVMIWIIQTREYLKTFTSRASAKEWLITYPESSSIFDKVFESN